MAEMSDNELLGYAEIHCKTERALFVGCHINRIAVLAGLSDGVINQVGPDEWFSMHEEMQKLVDLARANMREKLTIARQAFAEQAED